MNPVLYPKERKLRLREVLGFTQGHSQSEAEPSLESSPDPARLSSIPGRLGRGWRREKTVTNENLDKAPVSMLLFSFTRGTPVLLARLDSWDPQ